MFVILLSKQLHLQLELTVYLVLVLKLEILRLLVL